MAPPVAKPFDAGAYMAKPARQPQTREQWQRRRMVKIARRCEAALLIADESEQRGRYAQAQALRNAAAIDAEVALRLSQKIAEGHW